MLRRFIKSLYRFVVYAVGIIVLVAAVTVTVIRLTLPDIGEYRGEIEAWVSNYMGYPVVIHSINATWHGWTPHLELTNIDLLNKAGTQPITHFKSAQISINPIATILKRQFIPKRLMVSGFNLSIALLSNGAIYVEGIKLENPEINQANRNELAEWLFRQDEIEIQNAQIELIDVKHQQDPILLKDVSLTLRSDEGHLQVEGSTVLPSIYASHIDFAFDSFGDLLTSDWSGILYINGTNINPDNWYKNYRPIDFDVSGGSANLKVWSSWQQAKLTRLEGELQYKNFKALSATNSLYVDELEYQFLGKRVNGSGWQFQVNINNLMTDNGLWPNTNILISAEPTHDQDIYRYTTNFSYLKIDDLKPLISNLSFLPEKTKILLNEISIDGELSDGEFIYDPSTISEQQFTFDSKFDHLSTTLNEELLKFSDLSGRIHGSTTDITVSLDSSSMKLYSSLIEGKKILLPDISGDIKWSKNSEGWKLETKLMKLKSSDFTTSLSGTFAINNDNPTPFLDLSVEIGESDLEKITDYLPILPRFKFRNWMERCVMGGNLSSANILFRGYLSDFPFDENNGRFQLIANVNNVTLDYSPVWVPVDQIDAEIKIDGRKMLANIHAAKIFDADITTAKALIPDIFNKKKKLLLDGHINGEMKNLTLFIDQSPLKKDIVIRQLNQALKNGDFGLDLELDIPIKQKGKKTDVVGKIHLSDASLTSTIKNLQLESLNGDINFTTGSVLSESLTGRYYKQPVNINIFRSNDNDNNPPTITISGNGDELFITNRLVEYIPTLESYRSQVLDRLSGETPWQVKLTYYKDEMDSTLTRQIDISSDLTGLEINLPFPIGKAKYSSSPISVSASI